MEVLSTRKISAAIEDIVDRAEKQIIIVSPYLKISKTLQERLLYKIGNGVLVDFLFGKVENDFSDYREIRASSNVAIFFLDNLHAKVYGNESKLLLTSMNLHSFSETNSWELGIGIDSGSNEYEKMMRELKMMFRASVRKYGNRYPLIANEMDELDEWIHELTKQCPGILIERNPNGKEGLKNDLFSFKIEGIAALTGMYSDGRIIMECPDKAILDNAFAYYSTRKFGSRMRAFNNSNGIYLYPREGLNTSKIEPKDIRDTWTIIIRDVMEIFGRKS